jgi:hypothetical protein
MKISNHSSSFNHSNHSSDNIKGQSLTKNHLDRLAVRLRDRINNRDIMGLDIRSIPMTSQQFEECSQP